MQHGSTAEVAKEETPKDHPRRMSNSETSSMEQGRRHSTASTSELSNNSSTGSTSRTRWKGSSLLNYINHSSKSATTSNSRAPSKKNDEPDEERGRPEPNEAVTASTTSHGENNRGVSSRAVPHQVAEPSSRNKMPLSHACSPPPRTDNTKPSKVSLHQTPPGAVHVGGPSVSQSRGRREVEQPAAQSTIPVDQTSRNADLQSGYGGVLPTNRYLEQTDTYVVESTAVSHQGQLQIAQPIPLQREPSDVVVSAVSVAPMIEDNKKEPQEGKSRKRLFVILCLVLVVAVGGGATGAAIVLGGGNGRSGDNVTPTTMPPTPSCGVCFGNDASTGLNSDTQLQTFQFQNRAYSCASLADATTVLTAEDPMCPLHQAMAWKHCGCLTLPPSQEFENACPICDDAVSPLAPDDDCAQEIDFATIIGSLAFPECAAQVSQIGSSCVCPHCTHPRCVELQNAVNDLVDDPHVFANEATPQFKSLRWLALEDPGDMTVARPTDEALRERFVIVVLYFSTDGPAWRGGVPFLTGSHVCEWQQMTAGAGISCNDNGFVDEIVLGKCCQSVGAVVVHKFLTDSQVGVSSSGQIPVELRFLSALRHLELSSNSLVGSIPSELGTLTALEEFIADSNLLTGHIPDEIFAPPRLSIFEIQNNQIEGMLPPSLSNATSLRHLVVSNNMLTGTLPDFLGQSTVLEAIQSFQNSFSGSLPEFSPLSPLWFISSSYNDLTGTIPLSLARLTTLEVFSLVGNRFSGSIPPFSGNSGRLRVLVLSGGSLTGNLEEILNNLSPGHLQSLDLSTTLLTGTIPSTIGEFTALTSLFLQETEVHGTLPTELGKLTDLISTVALSDCLLTGTLPTELGRWIALPNLFLDGNSFIGTIPSEIGRMNSMVSFETAYNDLSGTIPTEIGNCRRLEDFGVFGNGRINGSMTDVISRLPTTIKNAFIGDLSLSGSIPSTVGRLSLLEILNARLNVLTGTLPTELGNLSNMVSIDLFGNRITGALEPSIGGMTQLTTLFLGFNSFNGTIPRGLSVLDRLEGMDLSRNFLTGSPGFLGGLQSLSE